MKNLIWLILLFPFSPLKSQSVSTGTLIRVNNFASQFVASRNIDIWLPEGYTLLKKYPVIYMHDGQMLFDSTTTWNRQDWGVDETMGRLIKEKKINECIVVGIWNNGKYRHAEYFPQKALPLIPLKAREELMPLLIDTPRADQYLKFMVFELKPFIDRTFSTRKDKSHTFIAGSSMGGLISVYAICEYPGVFGGAACLSTHWTGIYKPTQEIPEAIDQYLQHHLPSFKDHKIYFDRGTETLDTLYGPSQKMVDCTMKQKGFTQNNWITRIFPGQDHSESSWKKRLSIPIIFLLGKH